VHGGEVLQERGMHGAGEVATVDGAVARLVRARPGVPVAVMVCQPLGAAVGSVRARDADRVQHLLACPSLSWQGEHTTCPTLHCIHASTKQIIFSSIDEIINLSSALSIL
jgi:hypothetical protein